MLNFPLTIILTFPVLKNVVSLASFTRAGAYEFDGDHPAVMFGHVDNMSTKHFPSLSKRYMEDGDVPSYTSKFIFGLVLKIIRQKIATGSLIEV